MISIIIEVLNCFFLALFIGLIILLTATSAFAFDTQLINCITKYKYFYYSRHNGLVGITPATNLQKIDEQTIYQSADDLHPTRVIHFVMFMFSSLLFFFILDKYI